MDYWCMLSLLGNSSTTSGKRPRGTIGPSYSWPLGFFFSLAVLSRFTLLFSHSSSVSISFLLFPCSSVWKNTRAWVPHFILRSWMELALFAQRKRRKDLEVDLPDLLLLTNYLRPRVTKMFWSFSLPWAGNWPRSQHNYYYISWISPISNSQFQLTPASNNGVRDGGCNSLNVTLHHLQCSTPWLPLARYASPQMCL